MHTLGSTALRQMLYNWETRKFVLFFHLDTADFSPVPGRNASGHVGILTADQVLHGLCLHEHLLSPSSLRMHSSPTYYHRQSPT